MPGCQTREENAQDLARDEAQRERLATLAQTIINRFGADDRIYHYEANPVADPLIGELIVQGYIPTGVGAHVEWEGVLEHKVVPVFWVQDDEIRCTQVLADGRVEQF